jgi:ribose transport system ATP-binding protein
MMLRLKGVTKAFPGVRALDGVSFEIEPGEIHGLVGENGAGKSTLIKAIAGAISPDAGEIWFDGQLMSGGHTRDTKNRGIHVVYQEFVLFPHLTVSENLFLGQERRNRLGLIDYRRSYRESKALLTRMGVAVDPRIATGGLAVSDQQMIEIGRAMVNEVKLLILDEPTAVIAGREVALLFERLKALRAAGVSILFVSHRLEEVFEICDRVTVLKDGRHVATTLAAGLTREALIRLMVGRDLSGLYPPKRQSPPGPIVFRTKNLSVEPRVKRASIEVRRGEITALAGMLGSGRTELALGMFGALPISGGGLEINGQEISSMSPAKAIHLGIGMLSEDRKGQGLAMLLDVAANISAPFLPEFSSLGIIKRKYEYMIASEQIEKYRVTCRGPNSSVATMSGGNQQKVLMARWARSSKTLLILDEPTRGVDVGAKAEIYRMMRMLVDGGVAILMISSELTEVVGLADRVFTMREGVVTGELLDQDITEENIMRNAIRELAA